MDDDPEQLNRHVDDLLEDRRPERTPLASEDALRARQAAALLRAARPGAGLPTPDFLQQMQRSIDGWVREQTAEAPAGGGLTRRHVLLGSLGGIAAGVLAAVGIGRVVESRGSTVAPPLVFRGSWQPVSAMADLPDGTPIAFRSGAIEGFLIREGDSVRALSAVCTHMGCVLNWSKFRNQFECPCHGANFDRSGHLAGGYDWPLPPLPSLKVRIDRGQVEVYTV